MASALAMPALVADYPATLAEVARPGGKLPGSPKIALVKVDVVLKDGKKPLVYKLLQRGGSWVVFDIVIDDISLEETYSEDYTAIIVDEGWPALIQKMKDRVKELEAPPAKKSSKKKASKSK